LNVNGVKKFEGEVVIAGTQRGLAVEHMCEEGS
jgi:hypothetical protein